MQTHPGRFTQLVLTVLGLGLLVVSVALNHYHPRTAGVAPTGHNSIALALGINHAPITAGSAIITKGLEPLVRSLGNGNNLPSQSPSQGKSKIAEAVVAVESPTPQSSCVKMDSQPMKPHKNKVVKGEVSEGTEEPEAQMKFTSQACQSTLADT